MDTKLLFDFTETDPLYEIVMKTAVDHIRNPDKGSEFEDKTKQIRGLPDSQLLGIIKENEYDVLIGYESDGIRGYFAYQKQENDLHVFRVYTAENYRRQPRIVLQLAEEFLSFARRQEIDRVRIGAGNHKTVNTLIRILSRREEQLGIKVDTKENWIKLIYS